MSDLLSYDKIFYPMVSSVAFLVYQQAFLKTDFMQAGKDSLGLFGSTYVSDIITNMLQSKTTDLLGEESQSISSLLLPVISGGVNSFVYPKSYDFLVRNQYMNDIRDNQTNMYIGGANGALNQVYQQYLTDWLMK